MGLCNSPDIFQEHMLELFLDLENVWAYIDDLLMMSCSTYEEHLERLEKVFLWLSKAGLKVNANNTYFTEFEIKYLGYWITWQGIQPLPKKVKALQNIAPPKNKKQLQEFLGMVNYYRDMWIQWSEVLAPLMCLTSANVKFEWSDVEQMALDKIKQIVGCETLLSYPDFNLPFEINTNASHTQLGAVISQNNKPIAFYSRKLQPAQRQYTATECKLLSIIETLKEFKNILLGQQIVVYTDHKNLTYNTILHTCFFRFWSVCLSWQWDFQLRVQIVRIHLACEHVILLLCVYWSKMGQCLSLHYQDFLFWRPQLCGTKFLLW